MAWFSPRAHVFLRQGERTHDAAPCIGCDELTRRLRPLIPNGISYPTGEYLGAPAFTKDGSIWAAFSQHTGSSPTTFAVKM